MTSVRAALETIALLASLGLFSRLVVRRPVLPSGSTVAPHRETGGADPPAKPHQVTADRGSLSPKPPSLRCPHPEEAWATADGMMTCSGCGTRRVIDFRALSPSLESPERPQPDGATVTGIGILKDSRLIAAGDRSQSRAALLRKVREANRRSGDAR
ncbi:DUF6255 family natural product biosynthesis protein [Streptomyces syringium]|uniref:DUF6255 family natural product biosynthesis protein n=1 Tax=Streptomyces syringium TaxID=76729 RepID=UPI0034560D67